MRNGDLADTGGTCESAVVRLEPLLAFKYVDGNETPVAMFLVRGDGDGKTVASACELFGGKLGASVNLELRQEETGCTFDELVFVGGWFIEGLSSYD